MSFGTVDLDLRDLAAAGDSRAFAELARRHLPALYDFSARLLRDAEASRVVLGEVFTSQASDRSQLASGEFRVVAFELALRRSLERLRRTTSVTARAVDLGAPVDESFCRGRWAVSRTDHGDIGTAVLVWQVAESLDRRQYALLDLSVRQRFSTSALAHATEMPASAMESTLLRMRAAVESAMTAVVVAQRGKRWCHDLEISLADEDRLSIGEEGRKRVERHIETCTACTHTATRFGPLLEIYRSFQPLVMLPGVRSTLLAPALALLDSPSQEEEPAPLRLPGSRAPMISQTGRIVTSPNPVARTNPRAASGAHRQFALPVFRAAKVPLRGAPGSEEEQAYSFSPAEERPNRMTFYGILAGLGAVAIAGLAGLAFIAGGGDDPGSQVIASDTAQPTAATEEASSLAVSAVDIDLGSDQVERVITLEATTDNTVAWNLSADQPWLTVSPDGGSASLGEPTAVLISANRSLLAEGLYAGKLTLTTSDGETTEVFVELVVPGTGPTITDQRVTAPTEEETGAFYIYKAGCEPETTAFRVSASIADPSGIALAALVYSVGQDPPESSTMEISGDRYEGSVAPLTRDGPIVYHLEATDEAGNTSATEPITVEVRECGAAPLEPLEAAG
jgi:Viral BACON domain